MFHFFFINIGAIWNIRSEKQATPHPWRPKEIVVGVRESRNGANKKLAKNLCLPRYNEGIGIGGVFKGYLQ